MSRKGDDEKMKRALENLRNEDPAPEWMRVKLREMLLQEAATQEQAMEARATEAQQQHRDADQERVEPGREQEPTPGDVRPAPPPRVPRPWWKSSAIRIASPAAAAAALAAILIRIVGLGGPAVSFAEILGPVIAATGESECVHLVLSVREDPHEEMGFIEPGMDPVRAEAWARWPSRPVPGGAGGDGSRKATGAQKAGGSQKAGPPADPGRLRVEKPEWSYTFDGKSAVYYWPKLHQAQRHANASPRFEMVWPAAWVEQILSAPKGAEVVEHVEGDTIAGTPSRLLLRWGAPGLNGREPRWFDEFAREVEIQWDARSKRLTGLRRWVQSGGERVLVSELVAVAYLPAIPEETFAVALPEDVRYIELIEAPPEIDALGPREAAERFWRAAIAGDWETVRYFVPDPTRFDWLTKMRPTELRSLGQPAKSGNFIGVYIPYEVRYAGKGGRPKYRLAMRNDNVYGRWIVDGGI